MNCDLRCIPEDWFLNGLEHKHTGQVYKGDKHEPIGWKATIQHVDGGGLKEGVGSDPQTALLNAVSHVADIDSFVPLTRTEEFQLYEGDLNVKIDLTTEKVAGIMDRLIRFIRDEDCTSGESLCQMDSSLIEAPTVLSNMVDSLEIEDDWVGDEHNGD